MTAGSDAKELARDLLRRHGAAASAAAKPAARRRTGLEGHPQIEQARQTRRALESLAERGLPNPYFIPHDGTSGPTIDIGGQTVVNFAAFNYLGLSYHPDVIAAAKAAIDQYGSSASASRPVAGEVAVYRDLEAELAAAYGVNDAVLAPSGYLINAAVIPFLLTPADLAVCDSLVHSSLVAGTRWAQCRRVMFRHNDPESLRAALSRTRGQAERAMVVIEGVYSMDGDIAPLPEIVAIAREFDCLIMIDEAHSLGTLGAHGLGAREHFGLSGDAVDIWMGTLSKALAGCGGFVAGNRDLVWAIRLLAPGISLYTAPASPGQSAASLAALRVLRAEPDRVDRLRANAARTLAAVREGGWDTGTSAGTPIVPLIIGEQMPTVELSIWLLQQGIYTAPITQPGVDPGQDRIRLFLSSEHTADQIDALVDALDRYRAQAG